VTDRGARFADDTLAGSVTTMDAVFRRLMHDVGLDAVEAARLCATSPARALGLHDAGAIAMGSLADLVVLDEAFQVRQTWISGALAWNSGPSGAVSHPEEHG
jgi:N-acetylglucosamine-6-phosphate deacetylase